MKHQNKNEILVVPGTGFIRAYSGTHYLIEELISNGVDVQVVLRCGPHEADEYRNLPFKIQLYVSKFNPLKIPGKIEGMFFRFYLFFKMLACNSVLVTETKYLFLSVLAKKIKPSLLLVHFCQELTLLEDYPDINSARIYARYAKIPDVVIDVEPHRAQARKEKVGLQHEPFVLMNTMPARNVMSPSVDGTLAQLAGVEFPKGIPVLLHAGGIGKEKPLERVIDAISLCKKDVFFLAFCSGQTEEIQRLSGYAATKLKPGSFLIRKGVPRSKLMPAMHEADIGVIDYTYSVEPTLNQKYCAPTKLFEFMAYGVTVLGSNNESLRDIVEVENIGFCAREDSIESFSRALDEILSCDAEILGAMKTRARELFYNKYSYEVLCSPQVKYLIGKL